MTISLLTPLFSTFRLHRFLPILLSCLSCGLVLSLQIFPIYPQASAIASPTSVAMANPEASVEAPGYPIRLDNQVIFEIKVGIPGATTPEERATLINQRLQAMAEQATLNPAEIQISEQGDVSIIRAQDHLLLNIRPADAAALGQTRTRLATRVVQRLRQALVNYRQARSAKQLFIGGAFALISTFVLLLFWQIQQWFFRRFANFATLTSLGQRFRLNLANLALVDADAINYLLTGIVRLLQFGVLILSFYLYLPFVLSQFPNTRYLGENILQDIGARLSQLLNAFLQYLPNLLILLILGWLTYYLLGFFKLVIEGLGQEHAFTWFYPEWTKPTQRLVTLLTIAIAAVVALPYLPGFNSPAFQGVSLFVGALLTLGSSSIVANSIAGFILIYTRAFRLGDMIQINGYTGEVKEKSLFVTRILTPKQEIITIPNTTILNGQVTNYSAILHEKDQHYLLLHTTITLGYDAPWAKVYATMIEAGLATEHVIAEPRPFVLQTSLNDFHVSYELNVFTDRPDIMPRIYSQLHQNLQDYCNQAGIEILSPGYTSLRDGNHSTIPEQYLPEDYTVPGFNLQSPPPRPNA